MSMRRLAGAALVKCYRGHDPITMVEGEASPVFDERLLSIIVQALWTAMMYGSFSQDYASSIMRGRAPLLQIFGLYFFPLNFRYLGDNW